MTITEPMTMFTDYLIFIQSLYFVYLLKKKLPKNPDISQQAWMYALLAIGLASFFGGTHHGFDLMLSENVNHFFWKLTVNTIGLVSFLIVYGTMKSSVPKSLHVLFFSLSFTQMLVYFYWMISHDQFKYVIIDYVPSMILVFAFQLISMFNYKTGSEKFMMSGVMVSFIGAGIQQSGFDLHQHFNHNDIYHIIQMFANYLFYRGTLLLKDQIADKTKNGEVNPI